jgi:hypothetical protein
MITRIEAERSVTQLLCLILGGKQARASSHLSESLSERLELCLKLVQQEMQAAIHNTDPDQLTEAIGVGQRKLTSIQSLKTLNQLIQECEW